MSLREVQVFLARYVRDQEFRHRYREDGPALLDAELDLTEEERRLIGQIKLDHLDVVAEHVLAERMGRTNGVFGLLMEHLARFVDLDECYAEFDRRNGRGWWQRRAETRRFEAYVLDLVVANQLPEYLVDLCRFCAEVTTVAESPKVPSPTPPDLPPPTTVRANDLVTLHGPFTVLRLRHDVVRLMDDPEGYGAAPFPVLTDVLIQRDWRQHKRSRIFRLRDEPVLAALTDRPATVLELGGRIPELPYAALLAAVAELYEVRIVHLTPAAELAGDLAPASTR